MSVEIAHVTKRFGKVTALNDVSLTIGAGERVALIGSNGSGKTTLMRSVLGVLRFDGVIRIFGHDVAARPVEALSQVAYVPQIAPPIDVPLHELMRTWSRLRGVSEGEVVDRSRAFGLDVLAERRKRFADLSGGMKQKLLAAFALASAAPVLVCDEPTANLDPQARVSFFQQVAARPANASVILCSHRLDEVRQLVDRVVELRDGAVIHDGSVSELLDDRRAYRVEVWLQADAAAAAAFLVARGFLAAGPDRYAALLTQRDKLSAIEGLMRHHDRAVRDLGMAQVDALPPAKVRVLP